MIAICTDCRLLREYLEEETRVEGLPFAYDLERAIDDFVLLCILVGNDFLPHSPTLDIAEGAMDELFETYRAALPGLGGYLTQGGCIDHGRLERYVARLATGELNTLIERAKVCLA
jgi:5'-3' exonuclease